MSGAGSPDNTSSLYPVGASSTSPSQVVMISNTSGPQRRQSKNTFFLSHSHLSQDKTTTRRYTPYYNECLEIIFFPLASPVLNLHFTIPSKRGSNPHKSSFLKPHIQIPGFRHLGKILQSRHWQRCDARERKHGSNHLVWRRQHQYPKLTYLCLHNLTSCGKWPFTH